MDVADRRPEACEPDQNHDLAQPVKLGHSFHAAAERRPRIPPRCVRQAPGMEVGTHRHVVAEPLGSGEQLIQPGFLHRDPGVSLTVVLA